MKVFAQPLDFTDDSNQKNNETINFELSLSYDNPKNIWSEIFKDKNFNQISIFLDELPLNSKERVVQDIIFKILTGSKVFTKNKISQNEFKLLINKFAENLFITGRFSEIEYLYSQYPDFADNSLIIQKMIEGNLLRNRHGEACKILENNFDETLLNLGKIMIMCNIINNKFDEAKLGLQLLKEQNNPGDIFFIDLAFSLMSEKDSLDTKGLQKTLDTIKELNPIIISSLQFADISPTLEQIERFSISGLLSVLSNPSVDKELKIYCSEILVKIGRIDAEMLSDAYQLVRFKPSEIEGAMKIYKTLSPNRARPLLYQAILRDKKPETRFPKIISLVKVSQNNNLSQYISQLIDVSKDLKKYAKTHEDSLLLSKLFQSRNLYNEANEVISENYKKPESDYRKIALQISEALNDGRQSYYGIENDLELIKSIESQGSLYLKKILMVMSLYIDLDQQVVEKLKNISLAKELKISANDFRNLFLAEKLSSDKDLFNSISLILKIFNDKNFENLSLIQSYTILLVLENLGLSEEFKALSKRVLL